jgi:hypothetical protein
LIVIGVTGTGRNWYISVRLEQQTIISDSDDIVMVATTLRRRLDIAWQELQLQKEGFELFSQQQADRVPEWKKMVEEFEADGTKRNPYQGAAVKGILLHVGAN